MASNVIPFEQSSVPAHIAAAFGNAKNTDYEAPSGAVPSVSFRGKVWRIVVDGEENPLLNSEGDPVATMSVVMIKGNPKRSKAYYGDKKYVEGESAAPVCASRDGIAPDAGVEAPQCATCAACPQNVWGSRISEQGKKVKACADSKRIAVVPAGDLNFTPLLLSVPATSLSDKDNKENEAKGWYGLSEYAMMLEKRGVPVEAVVTKIGFDSRPAYPKLLFKAVGYLDEEGAEKVVELRESEAVSTIIGLDGGEHAAVEDTPAPAPKAAEKPKAKAAPAPDEEDEPAPAPKAKATKSAEKAKAASAPDDDDAPVAPAKSGKAPAASAGDSELKSKVASILGSLDIDDDE